MSSKHEVFEEIIRVCERAASGDLEARLVPTPKDPQLAKVCLALNHLLDMADSYVRESSAAMECAARGEYHRPILRQGMKGSYRNAATTVNRAALRMKQGAETIQALEKQRQIMALDVAKASEEAANNVGAVAAACQELSACTTEITRQTGEAAQLTQASVQEAQRAQKAALDTGENAGRIGAVVDLISKIAQETNMLALNATIEAARAGEHGRSFAVVATEVKNLSRETAEATEKIRLQIEEMQASVQTVATLIGGVGDSIHKVDDVTASIAKSIGEQAVATEEITRRITEVSRVTVDLSRKTAAAAQQA